MTDLGPRLLSVLLMAELATASPVLAETLSPLTPGPDLGQLSARAEELQVASEQLTRLLATRRYAVENQAAWTARPPIQKLALAVRQAETNNPGAGELLIVALALTLQEHRPLIACETVFLGVLSLDRDPCWSTELRPRMTPASELSAKAATFPFTFATMDTISGTPLPERVVDGLVVVAKYAQQEGALPLHDRLVERFGLTPKEAIELELSVPTIHDVLRSACQAKPTRCTYGLGVVNDDVSVSTSTRHHITPDPPALEYTDQLVASIVDPSQGWAWAPALLLVGLALTAVATATRRSAERAPDDPPSGPSQERASQSIHAPTEEEITALGQLKSPAVLGLLHMDSDLVEVLAGRFPNRPAVERALGDAQHLYEHVCPNQRLVELSQMPGESVSLSDLLTRVAQELCRGNGAQRLGALLLVAMRSHPPHPTLVERFNSLPRV